jgi:uncharacterized protein
MTRSTSDVVPSSWVEGETVTDRYHPAQRALQDRFDTRRLADRLAQTSGEAVTAAQRAFIEARDMVFIATADEEGWPEVSYKGGAPGFVRVVDEQTLVFPLYNGNGMYLTAGNLAVNPRVGLLFLDLTEGTRLRLTGEASTSADDLLLRAFPGAELVVRVAVRQVFENCRRYVHRYELVAPSPFVPSGEGDPPVPDWKRLEVFADALPADDPARDPDRPSAPSIPRF